MCMNISKIYSTCKRVIAVVRFYCAVHETKHEFKTNILAMLRHCSYNSASAIKLLHHSLQRR